MADNQQFKKDERQRQYEKRAKRRAIRKLHEAVKNNDVNLVRELITPDVDVDFYYNGETALQIAVVNGHLEIAGILINNGADVDKYNAESNSLLNMAAYRGHSGMVKLLVDHGADLDMPNEQGLTPINTAAYRGYAEVASILLQAGCNVKRVNNYGQSPLMNASMQGRMAVVKVLLDGQCDLNSKDNEGKTSIIVAAEKGSVDVVKMLIGAGCDVNATEKYRCTALYMAAKEGHKSTVDELIKAGADLNLTNTKKETPFLEAVRMQHTDIVSMLAAAGCDVNIQEVEMQQGPIHVALRIACQYFGEDGNIGMQLVAMLVKIGCDLHATDKMGWTPICQSVFAGDIRITKLLLEQNVSVNVSTESGDTPLHLAVFGNKPQIFDDLIKAGSCVNTVNLRNELPLYTAIEQRACADIIQKLLDAGSKTDICEKKHHETPLFAAIQHDYTEAVTLLIKAGCNINTPNDHGDTPLWVACDKGNEDVVRALVEHPDIDLDAGVEHIPLHAAAVHGYEGIARTLLEAGCSANSMTDICGTALHLAADRNSYPMAELLIQWGANPSAAHLVKRAKCCQTYSDLHPHLELEPLYASISNGNLKMVHLILTATPKMPYSILATLRDLIFRTGYAQEARLRPAQLMQYAEFFTGILSYPRELQAECRGIIRQCLGTNPIKRVQQLPIPTKLKDYVALKD